MSAHPHAADQVAGSKWDNKLRPDVTGNASSDVGNPFPAFPHFPPMVHYAPIHGLTVKHVVIECPSCFAWIHWDRRPVPFLCQGCGSIIDGATLSRQ